MKAIMSLLSLAFLALAAAGCAGHHGSAPAMGNTRDKWSQAYGYASTQHYPDGDYRNILSEPGPF